MNGNIRYSRMVSSSTLVYVVFLASVTIGFCTGLEEKIKGYLRRRELFDDNTGSPVFLPWNTVTEPKSVLEPAELDFTEQPKPDIGTTNSDVPIMNPFDLSPEIITWSQLRSETVPERSSPEPEEAGITMPTGQQKLDIHNTNTDTTTMNPFELGRMFPGMYDLSALGSSSP
mmetsp:Transcript_39024/g.56944  ORF Transcript_39024/g.56944 Transcript_39024/m.56944 type:complete len:172 (-) Transcript_39024:605-1120(-)